MVKTEEASGGGGGGGADEYHLPLVWKVLYVVLVLGPIGAAFFVKVWWQRGALVGAGLFIALQMLRVEQKHIEEFKGICPFCKGSFSEMDR